MGRLLFLSLRLPWWGFFVAAALLGYAVEQVHGIALNEQAAREVALASAPPPRVDLSEFSRARDLAAADELQVTGWVDHRYDRPLVLRYWGVALGQRELHLLFGAGDAPGSRSLRAALLLSPAEEARWRALGPAMEVGAAAGGPLVGFGGLARNSAWFGRLADSAIHASGLEKAPDFVFIAPFLEGRVAGLSLNPVAITRLRMAGWGLVGAVALIGLLRRVFGAKRRPAPAPVAPARPAAPAARPALAGRVAPNSPLGRIAARNAQATAPVSAPLCEPEPEPGASVARAPAQKHSALGTLLFWLLVGGACAALVLKGPGVIAPLLPVLFVGAYLGAFLLAARQVKRLVASRRRRQLG